MMTRQNRLNALERQVERLERRRQKLSAQSKQYWFIQLWIFLGGVSLVIVGLLISRWLGLLIIPFGIAAFIFVGYLHGKIDRGHFKNSILLSSKKTQVARMRLDWDALPQPLASEEIDHPFEVDLDLLGEYSLHRLMNTAVSFEGGQLLSEWLLHPPTDRGTILRRQSFVQELLPLIGFRNKLLFHSLLATRYTHSQYDESSLLSWLEQEQQKDGEDSLPRSILYIPTLACAATFLLFVLYLLQVVAPWLCLLPVAFSAIWFLSTSKRYNHVSKEAAELATSFDQLCSIFTFLENYPYKNALQLKKHCEPFFTGQRYLPSQLLKKVKRLARGAMLSRSAEMQFFVNAIIPFDSYNAYRLGQYKAHLTRLLPEWLDAWFELEALCSLANFAYLHPDYTFPVVLANTGAGQAPVLTARDLGHPLIPAEQRVVNDFELQVNNEIVLITGSNMAGKSTFLRTLGINLSLAYTGASVSASSLRTSLFELYACIKVSDSLADGYSYFYAEVRRLQGLLERLQEKPKLPIFFLIDEIYKGTNNEERLIGSTAYVHALAGQNCVGAISTHDLELVKLAASLHMLKNYHFREEVKNGEMTFDYKLHDGPCPTRNALKIMELVGLPTTWDNISQKI